jgi:hypothetical protein
VGEKLQVSISEINSFLKCRRDWDLTSASRQSLRHKTTPKVFFAVGSGFHAAVEANAEGIDWQQALEEYLTNELEEKSAAYVEAVGYPPWAKELEEFHEMADFTRKLASQYFDHYGLEQPLASHDLTYVATEVSFKIPIEVGGTIVEFIGTWDAIATDSNGGVCLVENKSCGRKPKLDILQHTNQFVGYAWAFQFLTGIPISGFLYNGVMKKLITEPRVLQNGTISLDKSQSVTMQSYLNKMRDSGISPLDKRYEGMLEFLEERERQGDDRFFFRETFTFEQTQVENWGKNLSKIVREMIFDPVIYPSFTYNACEMCLVKDLCHATEMGEDVEFIKQQRYKTDTYGTVKTVNRIEPQMITSVESLLETLRK